MVLFVSLWLFRATRETKRTIFPVPLAHPVSLWLTPWLPTKTLSRVSASIPGNDFSDNQDPFSL